MSVRVFVRVCLWVWRQQEERVDVKIENKFSSMDAHVSYIPHKHDTVKVLVPSWQWNNDMPFHII